ncbi:protein of unknown function (DUF928) [Cylindrospermum stagnale PCC 7417]|uniref:DUF928 domain-containing protein n=1 Tax=Cylindrospermum stagnale PCC 7417 TaxID=56107 RepID=K9WVA0_9NOST|nr:DUF928 domain-containing protein [Cylindrospermum stagnale]AFZ23744.1 protein of unknown function (DUF928) [Cylindrospermum stagnale PCC 7417]
MHHKLFNFFVPHLKLITLTSALVFSQLSLPQMAAAENSSSLNLETQFKPPNDGAPGGRKGGGSRPGCPATNQPITVLVPAANIGWTTSTHPTFWVYIPYQVTSPHPVDLVLRDDTGKQVHKNTFQFTGKPRIISYHLPETAPDIEIGKRYSLSVSFFCNPVNRSEANIVSTWVKRVALSPELKKKLTAATPKQRIILYAENGLWFDTLTALIELRRQSPDASLDTAWADLLKHHFVQLNELISVSLR